MRIARVATVPFFFYNHLRDQIAAIIQAGHDVVLISSHGIETEWLKRIPGVKIHEIEIPRKISPVRDLIALWKLYRFFRHERFDLVHSTTPKSGMLCAIASTLAGVPIRLHTFTGQVWMEMHGMMRMIAKSGDRLTARLNTLCFADSPSQIDFIVAEGICNRESVRLTGPSGSLSGVNLSRFDPYIWEISKKTTLKELGIPPDQKVVTFIGRVTRDKGTQELIAAFRLLRRRGLKCVLLLIGPRETKGGLLPDPEKDLIAEDIKCIGYSNQPERYLAVTDIFCLPSYREGFGNVVVEAAAMGIPAVGTDIIGLRDAIVNGETGILVPPKDIETLAQALEILLTDEQKRKTMGEKARIRARKEFSSKLIDQAVLDEYERLRISI